MVFESLGAINVEGEEVLRSIFRFAAKRLGRLSSARSVVVVGPACLAYSEVSLSEYPQSDRRSLLP